MEYKLILGDCLDKIKELEDNSIDSIVTDSPYGISFLGNKWDYDVPSVEIWKECFRVLKPGAHILSFSSPRTYHRMAVNVEDAGFEIRDQILWLYGSGFPKSHNLKPAHEPIVMARKPISEKTIQKNVDMHGTGAINIEDCRVGNEEININKLEGWSGFGEHKNPNYVSEKSFGRYPANLIHDGSEIVSEIFPQTKSSIPSEKNKGGGDFPTDNKIKLGLKKLQRTGFQDSGSAARYFYVAKPSKSDKEEGNTHPTIKPTELMRYLCRLITPKNGTILDPFCGSGSTGKAAMLEGFNFIGIELMEEYLEIAEKRIKKAKDDS
jgi:site-specific DNA-methyltransferase (adenine-specific)